MFVTVAAERTMRETIRDFVQANLDHDDGVRLVNLEFQPDSGPPSLVVGDDQKKFAVDLPAVERQGEKTLPPPSSSLY
jgi:hypothetical protein